MKMRYKVVESMCKDVKKHVQEKLEGQKSKEMREKPTAKRNKRAGKKKIEKKARAKKLRRVKKQENVKKALNPKNKRVKKRKSAKRTNFKNSKWGK